MTATKLAEGMAAKLAEGMAATYKRGLLLGRCAELADPALIAQHRALVAWPALIAKWHEVSFGERFGREPPSLPTYNGRSVGTPQMVPQATLDAAGDLDRARRGRLGDGRLRLLAFEAPRRLGDNPILLPSALVATATAITWRQGTITAGGMTFLEARVLRAEDLTIAEPEPEPEAAPVPPATRAGLIAALVELFHEERAWEVAGTEQLAEMVASRDPRFRPHHGPATAGRWSAATLKQRIREYRVEAVAAAAT